MITEDYVSFETAKLLKEKGFDGDTNCYYIEGSVEKNTYYSPIRQNHNKRITNNEFGIDINISSGKMSAPTLQMALKWFREKYKFEVRSTYDYDKDSWWGNINPMFEETDENTGIYQKALRFDYQGKSYEEAAEAAIKYCLKNLVKEL